MVRGKTYVLMMKPRKYLNFSQRPLTISSVFERLNLLYSHFLLHERVGCGAETSRDRSEGCEHCPTARACNQFNTPPSQDKKKSTQVRKENLPYHPVRSFADVSQVAVARSYVEALASYDLRCRFDTSHQISPPMPNTSCHRKY